MRNIIFGLLLIVPISTIAVNLGVYGQIFQIKEMDFKRFIYEKLEVLKDNGELKKYELQAIKRVEHHVYYPTPLNLPTTSKKITFKIDPSIVVNKTITDTSGHIIVEAGEHFNPFKHIHLDETLLFFNFEDPRQVSWAKKYSHLVINPKFILTGGDIRKASDIFGKIYFDQDGRLTTKLQIRAVPAIAEQDGVEWNITEYSLKNNGVKM